MLKSQANTNQLEHDLEKMELHEHLCLIYRSRQEELAAAVLFTKAGLKRNDMCVYVADDNAMSEVLEAMEHSGIAVHEEIRLGKLVLATKRQSYLKRGYFDPDWTREFFTEAAADATARGFRALRGNAEMTWQLDGGSDTSSLMEYEAKMNFFFPANEAMGLCQYRLNRFSRDAIRDVLYTHPKVIIGGLVCHNFYYKEPGDFLAQKEAEEVDVEQMLDELYSMRHRAGALQG